MCTFMLWVGDGAVIVVSDVVEGEMVIDGMYSMRSGSGFVLMVKRATETMIARRSFTRSVREKRRVLRRRVLRIAILMVVVLCCCVECSLSTEVGG